MSNAATNEQQEIHNAHSAEESASTLVKQFKAANQLVIAMVE